MLITQRTDRVFQIMLFLRLNNNLKYLDFLSNDGTCREYSIEK